MRCINCGCTDDRACPGGCSWVSTRPPKCSACFDQDGKPLYATGAPEGGLYGQEYCPASDVPALCVPLFTSATTGHCARCRQPFVCEEAA